jgi:hypothetical protein
VPVIHPLEWSLERVQWQNPRIRALLGCVRRLEGVLESNFAILHCSPTRLLEIWETVRQVCQVLRTDVTALMEHPSALPELDQAVTHARDKLSFLGSEVFEHLDRFNERPGELEFDDLRRTLCVAIGKLHGFLVDTLGEILAADPRSRHDVDYFLARKFPRDVEEAEWLQTSVNRLDDDLRKFNSVRHANLGSVVDQVRSTGRLPTRDSWLRLVAYLDEIETGLAPRLLGIMGLRGIRIDELDVLQAHGVQLPELCRRAVELNETAGEVLEAIAGSLRQADDEVARASIEGVERVLCSRITTCLQNIEDELRDLAAFVPLWLRSVEQRRALILRVREEPTDEPEDDPEPFRERRAT